MKKSDRIIQLFAETAPAVIRENFTPSCCLNATRCFVETMKHFNITASATVVETIAFNHVWQEQLIANDGEWPRNAKEKKRFMDAGGYSLAAGGPADEHGWPHHLVAIANGNLVDSSAAQLSRPDFEMNVPQVLIVPVPPSFTLIPQFVTNQNEEGCAVGYRVQPGVPYKHLPGWQLSPWNLRVTQAMVDAIKKAL